MASMVNCKNCGVELTSKNWSENNVKKRYYICSACKKRYDHKYGQEHKDIIHQRVRDWQINNPELKKIHQRNYFYKNRERIHKYVKERRAKFRNMVLAHYTQGAIKCARCGFSDERALSIDHINGGGTQHRKTMKSGGNFYEMLVKNGYPEGYQILCMNCQFIKRRERREM